MEKKNYKWEKYVKVFNQSDCWRLKHRQGWNGFGFLYVGEKQGTKSILWKLKIDFVFVNKMLKNKFKYWKAD